MSWAFLLLAEQRITFSLGIPGQNDLGEEDGCEESDSFSQCLSINEVASSV